MVLGKLCDLLVGCLLIFLGFGEFFTIFVRKELLSYLTVVLFLLFLVLMMTRGRPLDWELGLFIFLVIILWPVFSIIFGFVVIWDTLRGD